MPTHTIFKQPRMAPLNPRIWSCYFRVKYKELFHGKLFYKTLHEWLDEYEWVDNETGVAKYHEDIYIDRTDQYGLREIWIFWRVKQIPRYLKSNKYYEYKMAIDFHYVALKDVEIMHEGKKLKVNSGEVEMKVWLWIELDYKKMWQKSKVMRIFSQIFPRRIFKNELKAHERELYRQGHELQKAMKQFFRLKHFDPTGDLEPFHPSRAYHKY